MKQIAQLLLIQRLHVPPEPCYLRVTRRIAHVEGRPLPVLNIDILRPIEQHLYLMRLKYRKQLKGKHAVDGLFDLLYIPLTALNAEVVHKQLDVLLLVGVSHHQLAAVRFQLYLLLLAVFTSEVGEGQLEQFCVGAVQDMLPVCVELSVVTVKIAELQLLSADLSPNAAGEEAVQGHAVEQGFPNNYTQQPAHFHSKLVLPFFLRYIYNKPIGCLIGWAEFKQPWHLAIEDILDAEVHPLPQHSARIIDYLPVEADLNFLSEVDALEALVAGHNHVLTVDLQPLAPRLPTYAQLLHLYPQPRHLLLEAEVLDNTGLVVACLDGQQQHWLLGYGEFDPLVIGRDLDVNELRLILLELVAVASAHVGFVVGELGVGSMRVMVIWGCV